MKRYLPFIIVAAVALITFGAGFTLYRSKKAAQPTASKDGNASGLHVRGPNSAVVTIEEFGDFQCPPCSMMAELLKKTEEQQKGRLRVVFHHFPLAIHANARAASIAAEAAERQGRFWEMHDLLYREQASWSKAPDVPALFDSYAQKLGLDLARFKQDLQSPGVSAHVDADQILGKTRGVTSTPTLFVNNVLVPADALNPPGLQKAIETALKEGAEK
ncbi:MAG TPA: thioredoxin domain-containing protein [Chthoniobacterales bacterium]|jgi:protein-disulfide isomerase